jgi:hypothetical protein
MPIVADGALPNEIYIGKDLDAPLYTYTNNELSIGSIKGTFNCDIISNELPIDTFTFGVYYDENQDKVYLTRDTRQAYVCAGYIPGTLENSGTVFGHPSATVNGNDVALTYETSQTVVTTVGLWIQAPVERYGNTKFRKDDIVKIGIDIVGLDGSGGYIQLSTASFGYNNQKCGTLESQTGLFSPPGNISYTRAYSTGHDVITFTCDTWNLPYIRLTAIRGAGGTAAIRITGIEFNGEMVYGSFVPDVDPNTPPLIYVLSRRGNVPAKRYLKDTKHGTSVFWFCDSNLQGKGYLKTVERTGTNTWKLTSMSAIGLLDEKIHPGGYYTGQTFDEVVQEIVGDSFPYEYAPGNESIAELAVFGWLPYDSARNNLHRLLFAMGAVLKRVDNQGG